MALNHVSVTLRVFGVDESSWYLAASTPRDLLLCFYGAYYGVHGYITNIKKRKSG